MCVYIQCLKSWAFSSPTQYFPRWWEWFEGDSTWQGASFTRIGRAGRFILLQIHFFLNIYIYNYVYVYIYIYTLSQTYLSPTELHFLDAGVFNLLDCLWMSWFPPQCRRPGDQRERERYIYIYVCSTAKTLVYYFCTESSPVSGKCTNRSVAIGAPQKTIPIIVHTVLIWNWFAQSYVHARG